jgi:hypothetical protein
MGFVVDHYEDAISLLTQHGYQLIQVDGGADIIIEVPSQLFKIQLILSEHRINCVFSDIADTLYQA